MRSLLSLLSVILLSACGDSKFADLSGTELQDRYHRCENADSLSPGGAITCDNIRRECERRAEEIGRKVCY